MQVITHAVIGAPKAVVRAIMVEGGDETNGHRSEEAGMRPKLGGPSPTYNFTKEVKNIYKTYNLDQAKKMPALKTH